MDIIQELEKVGLTTAQYKEFLDLVSQKKNDVLDIDWTELIEKFNLPYSAETLRKASGTILGGSFVYEFLKEYDEAEESEEDKLSSCGINKDGSFYSQKLISMTLEDSKDTDKILEAHGFDPNCWDVSTIKNTVRQVSSKELGAKTLFSSYLTAKPKKDKEVSLKKIGEFFDRLDRNYSLPELKTDKLVYQGDKCLLIDIADLHMNLQSTMFVTGNEYNCDIAEKLFFEVIEDVINRTRVYDFEKIIFIIGGDMMNADNIGGTTLHGTPQDNELHYYDAYERLCAMTIKAIDYLKDYSCVDVIYVTGNHDETTGFKLAKYVDAWFRNDERVLVDYSPIPRKYRVYGNTLMCFAHTGDIKKLPAVISNEAREYWSQVEMTEVFLQHLHSEMILLEENNIRIQRLPTISGRSKWTNDSGFLSKRQCKSFVFDKTEGLIDILYTPIRRGE